MRVTSSCTVCRYRKKKCIIPRPGASCTLCINKKLDCNLAARPARRRFDIQPSIPLPDDVANRPRPAAASTRRLSSDVSGHVCASAHSLLGQALCDELIDLYFDIIDNKQLSLFHRSTFVADHQTGQVPDYLILGMVALVARFSEDVYFESIKPWDRGQVWLRRAIKAFNNRSELISMSSLQACILLSFAAASEGDSAQETLLSAQAVRMILWLRLPDRLSAEPLQREVEIRVFWQAWMMDLWQSARARLPAQMSTSTMAEKPLEEITFLGMRHGTSVDDHDYRTQDMQQLREDSIWSWMLPLCKIHNQVMMLNEDIINQPLTQFEIRNQVEVLSVKLDHWLRNLPKHLQNTTENQKYFADKGLIRTFSVPHLVYHHNAELLYYQFLNKGSTSNQQRSATDSTAIEYASRCKSHAAALSELMWAVNSTFDQPCLWSPINGHLLVVASSIHLHSLLFDTDEWRLSRVKEMLEHNFIMLLQFRKYWPTLEFSMSRLRAFHRACQVNSAQESFDMDRWMLEFLQRYNKPVGDRFRIDEVANEVDFPTSPFTDSTSEVDFWQELFESTIAAQ